MFESLELFVDFQDLKGLELTDEEIEGYMDLFLDNYKSLFTNAEIV